jgi:hypothetical protein
MNKLTAISLIAALLTIIFMLFNIYSLLDHDFDAIRNCVKETTECLNNTYAPK